MSFTQAAFRMFSGVLVWALHFGFIYGFTAFACARGFGDAAPAAIGAATAAAIVAQVAILALAWRRRSAFESWMAFGLAGLALIAIVWEALPALLVPPCA